MTAAERERRFEAGRCTGLRCRSSVEPGDGEQYVNRDGSIDRLCRRCAKKRNESVDTEVRS